MRDGRLIDIETGHLPRPRNVGKLSEFPIRTVEPVVDGDLPTGTAKKEGGARQADPLYDLEVDGQMRRLALFKSEGETHYFLNPEDPEGGIVEWQGDLASAAPLDEAVFYTHRGKKIPEVVLQPGAQYPVYEVPTEDGGIQRWAMVQEGTGATETYFIDPDNLDGHLHGPNTLGGTTPTATRQALRRAVAGFREAWDHQFPRCYSTAMLPSGQIGTACRAPGRYLSALPPPFRRDVHGPALDTSAKR